MNKGEIQAMAFQLIGYAGDAFSWYFKAIAEARKGNYEEAEASIAEGRKSMVEAHNTQNDLLTGEANGDDMAYSILMVHAQDHLTMALMYERLAQEFVNVYQELHTLRGERANE
mgnify:CR=1 FL=1